MTDMTSIQPRVRIYRPAKSAMQSGRAHRDTWLLEFEPEQGKRTDPLMGWPGGANTTSQVRLRFPTREAAEHYAKAKGLAATVLPDLPRTLKLQAYADNFR